jgi:hypothetical protein
VPRISTLRKWTAPLLDEAEVGPGKCVFAVYHDIMENGVFGATWYRTDGSKSNLRMKPSIQSTEPIQPTSGVHDFTPYS